MKDQINKTLIFIAIYITIVVTGCFAVADIWKTQGLTSKVYGALNIQTNNELKENEFKFIYTGFKETADGKYSFTQTNITNLTDLSNYSVRINSRDCETQSTTNTMFCDYSVAFKNYENNIIMSDTLNISVALHSGNLTFIFITENENSIPYWNKHFDLEGFTLELVEPKHFEIEEPIFENDSSDKDSYIMLSKTSEEYSATLFMANETSSSFDLPAISLPVNSSGMTYLLAYSYNEDIYYSLLNCTYRMGGDLFECETNAPFEFRIYHSYVSVVPLFEENKEVTISLTPYFSSIGYDTSKSLYLNVHVKELSNENEALIYFPEINFVPVLNSYYSITFEYNIESYSANIRCIELNGLPCFVVDNSNIPLQFYIQFLDSTCVVIVHGVDIGDYIYLKIDKNDSISSM